MNMNGEGEQLNIRADHGAPKALFIGDISGGENNRCVARLPLEVFYEIVDHGYLSQVQYEQFVGDSEGFYIPDGVIYRDDLREIEFPKRPQHEVNPADLSLTSLFFTLVFAERYIFENHDHTVSVIDEGELQKIRSELLSRIINVPTGWVEYLDLIHRHILLSGSVDHDPDRHIFNSAKAVLRELGELEDPLNLTDEPSFLDPNMQLWVAINMSSDLERVMEVYEQSRFDDVCPVESRSASNMIDLEVLDWILYNNVVPKLNYENIHKLIRSVLCLRVGNDIKKAVFGNILYEHPDMQVMVFDQILSHIMDTRADEYQLTVDEADFICTILFSEGIEEDIMAFLGSISLDDGIHPRKRDIYIIAMMKALTKLNSSSPEELLKELSDVAVHNIIITLREYPEFIKRYLQIPRILEYINQGMQKGLARDLTIGFRDTDAPPGFSFN